MIIETLIVLLVILILNIGFIIGVYNTIVTGKNDYEGQINDLKAEYQRRVDLFMNLVESVKSHVKFEKSTLTDITKARSGINPLDTKKVKKLDSVFAGMKIQLEAYPELKSNKLYKELMSNITLTEDRINSARGEMNNIAEDFNTYIGKFPVNIIAKLFNTKRLKYIKLGAGSAKIDAPKIAI